MKSFAIPTILLALPALSLRADVLLNEDFDAGDGGFTVTSEIHDNPWTYNAGSGTWSTNGSENGAANQHTRLTSPELDVSTDGGYVLAFDHRYDIEGGDWDGGAVFISVNGGAFTYVENTEFTENGYNTGNTIGAHALLGLPAFGSISPGHAAGTLITSVAGPFPLNAGDTVQFQFLMANDQAAVGTSTPNWEIDAITISTLDDADGDGMPDLYEDENGLDKSVDDSAGDLDGDTVTNLDEFLGGTDPQDADSDDDNLNDNVETNTGTYVSASDTGTNPLSSDTDGDTLDDGIEDNSMVFVNAASPGTNPNLADTDSDGFDDAEEIALGTNPVLATSVPDLPLVIGYWPFDDETSPTEDLSPNANHGTVTGDASFVPGHSGEAGDSAIDFDGVDDSVTTTVSLLSALPEYTMSGWLKFDVAQPNRTGFWGQNDCVEFGIIGGIHYWTSSAGALDVPFGPTVPEWTHILVTRTPAERKLYINGEESGTGTSGANPPSSTFLFNIGGSGIYDGTGNFFNGQIDDVAVWDKLLTMSQITDLASKETTPIGPRSGRLFQFVDVTAGPASANVTLEWNSRSNRTYAVSASIDLQAWVELDDGVPSEGETTEFVQPIDPDATPTRYFRVGEVQ